MEHKASNATTAFFLDLDNMAMENFSATSKGLYKENNAHVNGMQVDLPESLALKAHNRAIPTKAEIDANINKAVANREKILKAKVQKAKQHDEKVEKVKQLKKEMDENMTLLGNCIPCDKRTLPSSPTLPKRLKQRLEKLEQQSPPKTADMILQRENRAEENRNRILQQKREKARNSIASTTPKKHFEQPPSPPTSAPNGVPLPLRLQQRLASLPPKRTTKQLLDSYSRATRNREGYLRMRQEKIAQHLDHVATLQIRKTNAQTIRLPSNLKKRAQRISFNHTPEQILAHAEQVELRRQNFLTRRSAMASVHSKHVQHVAAVATEQQKALSERTAELRSPVKTMSPNLPKKLSDKMNAYLSASPTPRDILDHESNVVVNRMRFLDHRVRKAAEHSDKVEFMRMTRGNHKTPKMTKRLQQLLATRPQPKTEEQIRARWTIAAQRHEEILQERSIKAKDHAEKAFQVGQDAKIEQARVAEAAKNAKLEKAAAFLPDHLKQRLAQVSTPTKAQVLDRLNFADVNRARFLKQRADKCRAHSDKVEEMKMTKHNRKFPKLTAHLQQRLNALDKSVSQDALLTKERKAIERRHLELAKRVQYQRDLDTHAHAVRARLCEGKLKYELQLHKLEGAPYLPERLQKRLESFRHQSAKRVFDKEDGAIVNRSRIMSARAANAKAHNDKVEVMKMCKFNKRQAIVPKHLKERAGALKQQFGGNQTKERESAVAKNLEALLLERKQKAKLHNTKVEARMIAKRSARNTTTA